jgi:hypothetical protein
MHYAPRKDRMGNRSSALAAWLCISAAASSAAFSQPAPLAARSESGAARVTLESPREAPPLNRIHPWTVSVVDAQGRPLSGAAIEVDGGVPGLQRHLPTAPRMTKALGEGRYLIEGMKFDMTGAWRIRLDIRAGEVKDRAVFDIVVK